ncbi:hypothetical protein [Verminephrobacter aporrectodeae]|uniref:hypothetical protein n=1 Tax=Verminephrobacter aporrectodeae TaxID=1110389 RepID=UPI002243D973|nr:hypothetical protein [Verminephrobacter aporrectodeae]
MNGTTILIDRVGKAFDCAKAWPAIAVPAKASSWRLVVSIFFSPDSVNESVVRLRVRLSDRSK